MAAAPLVGCTATDACLNAPGYDLTFVVQPPGSPAADTNNQYAFDSIGAALDAATGQPTTVCLAAGEYRERNLVVPAGVHLRGAGVNSTRIRPTDSAAHYAPTGIDQVLLTLEPSLDEGVIVTDLDVAGAAVCAQVLTAGTSTLTDVRLADCGIGFRAFESGAVTLERVAVHGNRRVGIELRNVPSVQVLGPTELTDNGRGDLLEGETIARESQRVAGVAIGGAIRAQQVGEFVLRDLLFEGRSYRGGQVELRASSTVADDLVVDLFGIGEGGGAPAFLVAGGTLDAHAVRVRTQGQGLLTTIDAAPTLLLDSVAWGDVHPLAPGETPGFGAPALALDGGGTLTGQHLTLLGTNREPAIRLTAETELNISQSVLWGFGEDQVLVGDETPLGLGFSTSLLDDSTVDGDGLLSADPLFVALDGGDGGLFRLQDGSPARCAGTDGVGAPTDLLGNPRPATAGKAPDLGAIESDAPCP